MTNIKNQAFQEIPVICDDKTWVWHFIKSTLHEAKQSFVQIPSKVSMRHCWQRFRDAERIIIHWEGEIRGGGATIEELLDVHSNINLGDKIIVLTVAPLRDDIVYLSELGIKRIIRIRHREADLQASASELKTHLREAFSPIPVEINWHRLQSLLSNTQAEFSAEELAKLRLALQHLQANNKPTARYCEALGLLAIHYKNYAEAENLFLQAIQINPNFFRAYNGLNELFKITNQHERRLELLHKLYNLNNAKIDRLAEIGDTHIRLNNLIKAEHYFKSALAKDSHCEKALNGLAEIRFNQGMLEETREILTKTSRAYQFASQLNKQGVALVKQKKFAAALKHYTEAQYVLPHNEKGPQLFYNIGLCYSRWEKKDMARQFLQLALVKEPNYQKAIDLLNRLDNNLSSDVSV